MRLTEPRKWENPRFRNLSPEEKLMFFYLWERCDNAGFIPHDSDAASFYIGIPVREIQSTWDQLRDNIVIENDWVWVKDFPTSQDNYPIDPENPAHRQIVTLLREQHERFRDSSDFEHFIASSNGLLCSSLGTGFGKN